MNRLHRVKDSIERRNDFSEARRILDNAPGAALDSTTFVKHQTMRDIDEDKTRIARDRGNGRASLGIRFLELASISFIGKNLDSVIKFDTVPSFVDLRVFYSTSLTEEQKVSTIARSLGVEEFVTVLKKNNSSLLSEVNSRFLETFNEVESGGFRVSNSRRLLAFCRLLASRTLLIQEQSRRGEL